MSESITLCTSVKNEGCYLLEWLAYHRSIGINSFLIYDNESTDGSRELLASLASWGLIEHRQWPTKNGISPQLSAFSNAAQTLIGRSSFVANIDADEFLFLTTSKSFLDILSEVPDDVGALAINQRVVGSNGEKTYDPRLVLERFRLASETGYSENFFFKTIYRPGWIEAEITDPHSVRLRKGRYTHVDGREVQSDGHPGKSRHIDAASLVLNHYILKSWEEFANKRARGGGAGKTAEHRLERYLDDSFFSSRDTKTSAAPIQNLGEILARVKDEFVMLSNLVTRSAPFRPAPLPSSTEPERLKSSSAPIANQRPLDHRSPPTAPSMDTQGLARFTDALGTAQTYMEYGAGGSTIWAAASRVATIVSAESDQSFLDATVAAILARQPKRQIHPLYINIGPTASWGYPIDRSECHQWPMYAAQPWEYMAKNQIQPDLILIDGRFRVACFLMTILNARPGAIILFDDYLERPNYHVIERHLKPSSIHGRMAEFTVPESIDARLIASDLSRHSMNPT